MWKSFGGSGGRGGGGRGGMLRTIHRATRAGVGVGGGATATQEPFSQSTTNTTGNTAISSTKPTHNKARASKPLSLSSSVNHPCSATSTAQSFSSCDEFDWECVDGNEYERGYEFHDDSVLGTVPSTDEVQNAVSALQRVLGPAPFSHLVQDRLPCNSDKDTVGLVASPAPSSVGSESDWLEPSMHLCNIELLPSHKFARVYDAFHLLQTEPSIQRMVISLSSDKAVWNAVLNNEVVRELRESLNEADNSTGKSSDGGSDDSNAARDTLGWIFVNTKAKVLELVEKFVKLVTDLFQPRNSEKIPGGKHPFEEKLRTSFLLSVVVMLIVVVSRAHRA